MGQTQRSMPRLAKDIPHIHYIFGEEKLWSLRWWDFLSWTLAVIFGTGSKWLVLFIQGMSDCMLWCKQMLALWVFDALHC